MIYPLRTDLIPLLENLVAAIQPFAKANFVYLHFETSMKKAEITHHPETIIPDINQLLCRIITFTPQEFEVKLTLREMNDKKEKYLEIRVTNTGVSLEHLKDIVSGLREKLDLVTSAGSTHAAGTIFEKRLTLELEEKIEETVELVSYFDNKKYTIPPFFKRLKNHLNSHFTNIKNLEKAASSRSIREGVFLKKVNAIIIANLDQEGFNTTSLSTAMALSRSQLYRRLKPLIRFAPAHYIRYVRLQKAKEFLENEDVSIGDVVFRTGFISPSHFTRAFKEQFGFNPSDLKRDLKEKETN